VGWLLSDEIKGILNEAVYGIIGGRLPAFAYRVCGDT
jgi:hypothetical protein